MAKRKLIVLEGPDSVGKSVQTKILANHFNAKLIIQPSPTNSVGFLRDEVKNNPSYDPFSRQLLHTVSHIVDIFTEFDSDRDIVMDRCHISTYVYGKTSSLTDDQNNLLFKIHKETYSKVIKDNFDIIIIFLDKDIKYINDPTDEFEKTFKWKELKAHYFSFFDYLSTGNDFVFTPEESIYYLPVGDQSKEVITKAILELIEKGV
jgi:deoxyadenosine/deoxycytidine kinase